MEAAIPELSVTLAAGLTLIAAAVIFPSAFVLEWSIERDEPRPRLFPVLIAAQHTLVLMGCFSLGVAYPILALPLLALLIGSQSLSRALLRLPIPATQESVGKRP